ncbi:unnamed protein product [Prunus armeniaca]|uniref:Uncharacterized protein n=1 Tax=Prunus armeniaca TaxID=36596 RepID=A0A6J5W2U5_PRUAR|nr:unnamed protein product [Prunus armeniaca]
MPSPSHLPSSLQRQRNDTLPSIQTAQVTSFGVHLLFNQKEVEAKGVTGRFASPPFSEVEKLGHLFLSLTSHGADAMEPFTAIGWVQFERFG